MRPRVDSNDGRHPGMVSKVLGPQGAGPRSRRAATTDGACCLHQCWPFSSTTARRKHEELFHMSRYTFAAHLRATSGFSLMAPSILWGTGLKVGYLFAEVGVFRFQGGDPVP